MKILLVDDSQLIYKIVSTILSDAQIELNWQQNGLLGLEKIKNDNTFDVVLLDWNMPILDGPGFLQAYRELSQSSTPVIMLTTENKLSFIEKALSLGASEYIMKPFTEDILISKIHSVVAARPRQVA